MPYILKNLSKQVNKPQGKSLAIKRKNILDKSSPLFIAQMGSLVAQVLKLKQGKTNTTAGIEEERTLE